MNSQRKEIVRQLFAIATELLEDAHKVAASGQSPTLSARKCLRAVDDLRKIGVGLIAIADVATLLANSGKS